MANVKVISDQLLNVVFSSIPRYCPTSQNPESLTLENIDAPNAMAITIQASR